MPKNTQRYGFGRYERYTPKAGEEMLNKGEALSPDLVKRHVKKLRLAKGQQLRLDTQEALKFFQRQIPKTTRVSKKAVYDLMTHDKYDKVAPGNMFTGRMYLFQYPDPVWKEVIDMYDALPLVFFFNSYKSKAGKTILLGLNLHYLPPAIRGRFLLELMKLKTGKSKSRKARLRLSWEMIKNVSKSKAFIPSVHAYRVDRIKGQLVQINYIHWTTVTFLQISRFHKMSRKEVFADSIRKISEMN